MERRSLISELILFRNAREGTAAVEFALSASLLVPLFFGAFSLGLMAWTKMQVDNAARAGAIYAVSHDRNLAGFIAGLTAAAQNATALSTSLQAPTLVTAIASCIDPASGQITSVGNATACLSTGSPPGIYVTVTTQYSYPLILPVPGIANVVTLSGKAVARIQ